MNYKTLFQIIILFKTFLNVITHNLYFSEVNKFYEIFDFIPVAHYCITNKK